MLDRVLARHLPLVERHRRSAAARFVGTIVRLVLFLGWRRIILRRRLRLEPRLRPARRRSVVLDERGQDLTPQRRRVLDPGARGCQLAAPGLTGPPDRE